MSENDGEATTAKLVRELEQLRAENAELKRARPADLATKDQHRLILEAASDLVFSLTQDGRYTDANQALAEAFGNASDGTVREVVRTFADITEWKRAEEARHRSELALKASQRVAHLGSWTWYIKTNLLEWSDEMFRLFGIEPQGFTGDLAAVVDAAIHPDDREAVDRSNRAVAEEGKPAPLEYRVVWPDGTVRTVWAEAGELVRDAEGRPSVLTGIVQDITERKRAEKALRESDERTRTLVEWMPDATVVHRAGRILFVNPAAVRLFGGQSDSDLIGRPVLDLVDQEFRDVVLARMAATIDTGRPSPALEQRHLRLDGTALSVEVQGTAIPYDGETAFLAIVHDITDRKRAEAAHRESEERYRTIVENIPDALIVHDFDGNILDANDRACELYGYERDTLVGQNLRVISVPERMELETYLMDVLRERREARFEGLSVRRDGTRFPTDVVARLVSIAGRGIVHGFVRDVTDRKRAEDALSESQWMLNAVLDTIPARVFWKNRECRFLGCNALFAADAGLESPAEIVGMDDHQMSWRAEAEAFRADDRMVMDTGESKIGYEEPQSTTNGTRWLHTSKVPLKGPDGRILGVLGTYEDITDRKRAEDALRELTTRLHLATVSAKAGVWDWNLQTNEMVWDDRMLELYGLDRGTFPGGIEAWERGLHPEDRSRAIEECQAALRGEQDFDAEFRVRRPDGTVGHLKANGLVLRDGVGKPVRMIGLNTDITDRKHAEQERTMLEAQLQQAQKMESVGRLAGGVAHDFNNMLGVIIGHTELALEQVEPTQALREDLREIQGAARRSADLTRQLLAFARKQTVMPKVLDLNDILAGMLKMLERLLGENVRLEWSPSRSLWPVNADPSQIDQILANLCVNARDAIGDVGTLTIATANVSVDPAQCAARPGLLPGDYLQLVVRDDGCGMDRETLSHIFEPFFTTKGVGKGTGLGLATVYGIVKQNHGFIDVESAVGRGTAFTILLPRHLPVAAVVPDAASARDSRPGHETILLVEDEPAVLRLTKRLLGGLGYTVLTASTPAEAIRVAQAYGSQIELLVTDVIMPEMNGKDLARNLSSSCPRLRYLFMSGYTADVIAPKGVVEEGTNFIQKPFTKEALAAKVREALEQEPDC